MNADGTSNQPIIINYNSPDPNSSAHPTKQPTAPGTYPALTCLSCKQALPSGSPSKPSNDYLAWKKTVFKD